MFLSHGAGFDLHVGRVWPMGRKFDTPDKGHQILPSRDLWMKTSHSTAILASHSPSPGGSLPTFTPSYLWIRLKATRSFSDNWRGTCARWQVMIASPSSRTGEPTEADAAWIKHEAPGRTCLQIQCHQSCIATCRYLIRIKSLIQKCRLVWSV